MQLSKNILMLVGRLFVLQIAFAILSYSESLAKDIDILDSWVERQGGEVFLLQKDNIFQNSTKGTGKYIRSDEYGGNYKFSFRSGDVCWYNIRRLEQGDALAFSLVHQSGDCLKGIFDRVAKTKSELNQTDVIVSDSKNTKSSLEINPQNQTFMAVRSIVIDKPLQKRTIDGIVYFNLPINGKNISVGVPFVESKNQNDAIKLAITDLRAVFSQSGCEMKRIDQSLRALEPVE